MKRIGATQIAMTFLVCMGLFACGGGSSSNSDVAQSGNAAPPSSGQVQPPADTSTTNEAVAPSSASDVTATGSTASTPKHLTDRPNELWRDYVASAISEDQKNQLVGGGNGPLGNNSFAGIPGFYGPLIGHESEGVIYTPIIPPIAAAASWDPNVSFRLGRRLGIEETALGYSFGLGVGMNLVSDPMGGRTFEYFGEDPILAGTMAAQHIRGFQASGKTVETAKHYAFNESERNRFNVNHTVDERSARELHMLPFELSIKNANPGAIMCAYGYVNGTRACENGYLQTDVLKNEWGFKGMVLADCCDSAVPPNEVVRAINAGTDNSWPISTSNQTIGNIKQALAEGQLSPSRRDDAVRRHLTMVSRIQGRSGTPKAVDFEAGSAESQDLAEQSMVLLKNVPYRQGIVPMPMSMVSTPPVLPLSRIADQKILLLAGYSDIGVLWGGGSAGAKDPRGSPLATEDTWMRSSPLDEIRKMVPNPNNVSYVTGNDIGEAQRAAAQADYAIVFIRRYETEDVELPHLGAVWGEDRLIPALTGVPKKGLIVVVESGTAMTMPWEPSASAILYSWYPGIRGASAIARVLFGDVNPSGKLPLTFPRTEADLPFPSISDTNVDFTSVGLKLGYRWFDAKHIEPLYPFGYGLSYTSFAYSNMAVKVDDGGHVSVGFTLTNTGQRDGAEVAQVYSSIPDPVEPPQRLIGWDKVFLHAGESKQVSIPIDPLYLKIWDTKAHDWATRLGDYKITVNASSRNVKLAQTVKLTKAPASSSLIVRDIQAPLTSYAGVKQTYEIRGQGLDNPKVTASLGGIACTERSQRYDRIFRAWCQAPARVGSAQLVVSIDGQAVAQQAIQVEDTPYTRGGYMRVDDQGEPVGAQYNLATYTGASNTQDICVLQTRDQRMRPLDQYLLWEVKRNDGNPVRDTKAAEYGAFTQQPDFPWWNAKGALCGRAYQAWRLPNKDELLGLVNAPVSVGSRADSAYFPWTQSNEYWTATPAGKNAWATVNFAAGAPTTSSKAITDKAFYRLVAKQ